MRLKKMCGEDGAHRKEAAAMASRQIPAWGGELWRWGVDKWCRQRERGGGLERLYVAYLA
jgi:hypothetical protein